jgi:hypothetical protein
MVDARGMRGGGESPVVEFGILGPVQAVRDGRELGLGGPKPRAVLALLLVAAGRVVPAERLAEEVWGAARRGGRRGRCGRMCRGCGRCWHRMPI